MQIIKALSMITLFALALLAVGLVYSVNAAGDGMPPAALLSLRDSILANPLVFGFVGLLFIIVFVASDYIDQMSQHCDSEIVERIHELHQDTLQRCTQSTKRCAQSSPGSLSCAGW